MPRRSAVEAVIAVVWLLIMPTGVYAQAVSADGATQPAIAVLSGDSWQRGDDIYRLYGVQSCLRGSYYIDRAGERKDCGTVSAAVLAAFLRDTRPQCRPIAQIKAASTSPVTLVTCTAHIGTGELDLGSMLIAKGFAFAALTDLGQPVYAPYLAQELVARQTQKGLWAFKGFHRPDFRHQSLDDTSKP